MNTLAPEKKIIAAALRVIAFCIIAMSSFFLSLGLFYPNIRSNEIMNPDLFDEYRLGSEIGYWARLLARPVIFLAIFGAALFFKNRAMFTSYVMITFSMSAFAWSSFLSIFAWGFTSDTWLPPY